MQEKRFSRAIVRRPCRAMTQGITSAPELGKPDHALACRQHDAYLAALERCGLEVTVLPPDEQYPDSCFIEDPALVTRCGAILTNPGTASRNGEKAAVLAALQRFFPAESIAKIEPPATLDGGDVMMVGDDFYVGCSARSNAAGIQRLSEILAGWGLRCHAVPMAEMLHLKTGVSYLEAGRMLVAGEFVTQPLFAQFQRIPVPAEEAYAANSLWINGTVLVPAGYPATARAVAAAGYDLIQLEMSEFRKLDGGLSCLSLRF